jgi:hypothetical protein
MREISNHQQRADEVIVSRSKSFAPLTGFASLCLLLVSRAGHCQSAEDLAKQIANPIAAFPAPAARPVSAIRRGACSSHREHRPGAAGSGAPARCSCCRPAATNCCARSSGVQDPRRWRSSNRGRGPSVRWRITFGRTRATTIGRMSAVRSSSPSRRTPGRAISGNRTVIICYQSGEATTVAGRTSLFRDHRFPRPPSAGNHGA